MTTIHSTNHLVEFRDQATRVKAGDPDAALTPLNRVDVRLSPEQDHPMFRVHFHNVARRHLVTLSEFGLN